MVDSKSRIIRHAEGGNAVVAVLVVLVLVAVGAVAYLSGNVGDKIAPESKTAMSEPASGEQAEVAQAATEEAASPAEQAPQVEIKPGNPVVAKVNGQDITRLDVFNFMQTLGPQARQTPIDQIFPLVVDQVISSEIIGKKVAKVKLDNDPAVKAQLEAAKAQIVRGVFMQKEVEKAITDERLKTAYDAYVAGFPEIPELKTRHILVKEEKDAKDIIKQLKDGADFAALAKEKSVDATKENGGELGYISKQDQVIPEFLEAAFTQKIGEVSKKPVKSEFGYHVIEILESRMRPAADFEQAKPFLAAQLRNVVLNELVAKWRNEAEIEVFDINGDKIEPAAGDEAPVPASAEKKPADAAE